MTTSSSAPENLDDLLMVEMSRRNTDMVAGLVLKKPELFAGLFRIFASNREPVSRRAAWVIDTLSEKHPGFIEPYLNDLTGMLPEFSHDGLKRHTLRMLARSPFPPEQFLGELIKICFEWLLSNDESVAVKICCMEILYRFSQEEPDLKKELADTIELGLNEATPGVRNKGQKMLKRLFREMSGNVKP